MNSARLSKGREFKYTVAGKAIAFGFDKTPQGLTNQDAGILKRLEYINNKLLCNLDNFADFIKIAVRMLSLRMHKEPLILLYAVIAASIWHCGCTGYSASFLTGTIPLVAAFVLFGLIPIGIVKLVFCEKLSDYGLRFGIVHRTVRSFLLAAPIIVLIAYFTGQNSAFHSVYPLNRYLSAVPALFFILHCVLYTGYYFGWEFLFRGFIQHGLSARCGTLTAVMVQTLASTLLHIGHPPLEVFASIIAGLVWGLIAYRTQSILSGFGQHTLLGIVLDYTLLYAGTANT